MGRECYGINIVGHILTLLYHHHLHTQSNFCIYVLEVIYNRFYMACDGLFQLKNNKKGAATEIATPFSLGGLFFCLLCYFLDETQCQKVPTFYNFFYFFVIVVFRYRSPLKFTLIRNNIKSNSTQKYKPLNSHLHITTKT